MNLIKAASTFLKVCQESLDGRYIAIHLGEDSKRKLFSLVPPIFPNKFGDHVTIAIEPSDSDLETFGEGEMVPMEILGSVRDEKAQAVIISLPEIFANKIIDQGKMPHVTVSAAKGVPPVYSNSLVASGANFEPIGGVTIYGTVKFLKKK